MPRKSNSQKELHYYVSRARANGVVGLRGLNGGGWIALAVKCGASVLTKGPARSFLRNLFGMPTDNASLVAKVARATRAEAVKALEQKLASPPSNQNAFIASDDFLKSYEWRRLRMEALKLHGARCQCCGASPATGAVMNVDHIKPRRLFPWLALELKNLQVLCHDCNHGKGNWDQTDWRPSADDYTDESKVIPFLRSIANE